MDLLPALPNIRYVRISENGEPINLFRLDGTDEELDHAVAHMRETYAYVNPNITIELMDKYEALCIEWRFISQTCVPWEEAKKKLEHFEVALQWN